MTTTKQRMRQADWEAFCRNPVEATFEPIYESSKALVWTICVRILRDPEDAADAMQSTYCRLLRLAQIQPEAAAADLQQAIYRLAVREANRLRMKRRRLTAREVAVEQLPHTAMCQPQAQVLTERALLRERVEHIVDALPERYRVPLLLHYFNGLTHREVALALGTPVSTISNRIARAHHKLEPMLRRAGLGGALTVLAAIRAGAGPLQPPAQLTARVVYSRSDAILVGGGAAATGATLAAATSGGGGFFAASKGSLALLAALLSIAGMLTLNSLHAHQLPPRAGAAQGPHALAGTTGSGGVAFTSACPSTAD